MAEQEINEMIKDNEKLVYFVIHRYFPGFHDDEDVVQCGCIGLWRACANYDSTKGKLSSFATSCVKNAIGAELRSRERHRWFDSMQSLDAPMYLDDDGNDVTLVQRIPDTEDGYCTVDWDVSHLRGKLSKRDFKAFLMNVQGFTMGEIGKELGVSRQRAYALVSNAQEAARRGMPR